MSSLDHCPTIRRNSNHGSQIRIESKMSQINQKQTPSTIEDDSIGFFAAVQILSEPHCDDSLTTPAPQRQLIEASAVHRFKLPQPPL